ncbi:MAG: hypothetical protein ABSB19_01980 [Methylomonas sp.]|jgi:hypothetical protein
MSKIEAHLLPAYNNNIKLKNLVKQYKNYCTIRRDLRTASQICDYVIDVHSKLINDEIKLADIANSSFLIRASVMHAIILYGRWFKATEGKPKLDAKEFFDAKSNKMVIHNKIIDHRDRYIAHNELDLLGVDRVWINTNNDNKFISSESDWLEQMWLQDTDLNMATFRDCVHIVHNKIDASIIPKKQQDLDYFLIFILGKAL